MLGDWASSINDMMDTHGATLQATWHNFNEIVSLFNNPTIRYN